MFENSLPLKMLSNYSHHCLVSTESHCGFFKLVSFFVNMFIPCTLQLHGNLGNSIPLGMLVLQIAVNTAESL